jgi:Bacterial protein of unknown function (Gcw_chp)
MKKVAVLAMLAFTASTAAGFTADLKAAPPAPPPNPWDFAFGSGLMSDYNFRGISQSAHKPSVAAYFEPRYNITSSLQAYAGVAGGGQCFNDLAVGGPSCSVQGFLPNGNVVKQNVSFYEGYAKATYAVSDNFAFGGSVFYSPSVLNSGADGRLATAISAAGETMTSPGRPDRRRPRWLAS